MRLLIATFVLTLSFGGCARTARQVIVYTSVDQPFAEPVLREFEQLHGIRVRPVYDVESAKTTGLVNRLLAEKEHPRADAFWSSDIIRTIVLKNHGVLAPYHSSSAETIPAAYRDPQNYWTGFGVRARVLLVNTTRVKKSEIPRSILELTGQKWRGAFTMAYPLFGTTSAHVAAIFTVLGDEKARRYFKALKENETIIVDGNASVRDRVAAGDAAVGFTDTDDAYEAVRAGKPVEVVYPDQDGLGTLLVPNTVALVAGAPHPNEARILIDYLLSTAVEEELANSDSVQMPVRLGLASPKNTVRLADLKPMPASWSAIAEKLTDAMKFMQETFTR